MILAFSTQKGLVFQWLSFHKVRQEEDGGAPPDSPEVLAQLLAEEKELQAKREAEGLQLQNPNWETRRETNR